MCLAIYRSRERTRLEGRHAEDRRDKIHESIRPNPQKDSRVDGPGCIGVRLRGANSTVFVSDKNLQNSCAIQLRKICGGLVEDTISETKERILRRCGDWNSGFGLRCGRVHPQPRARELTRSIR